MYRVGDLVRLSSLHPNRMFLNTRYSGKVIEWNSNELGIILSIEGEYIYVFLPSGVGCCCVEELQGCQK